jgi:hypothetical protein
MQAAAFVYFPRREEVLKKFLIALSLGMVAALGLWLSTVLWVEDSFAHAEPLNAKKKALHPTSQADAPSLSPWQPAR